MGYLYAYLPSDPKNTVRIDSPEKMRQFQPFIDNFKQFIDQMEIHSLTTDKVEICAYDPKMFKKPYATDSKGCSVIDYSQLQNLLNNIRIPAPESKPVKTESVVSSSSEKKASTSKKAVTETSKAQKQDTATGSESRPTESGSGVDITDTSGYVLEYNTGRKDFVLGRMFEDRKITDVDYKNAVVGGIDFQFQKYNENIKYPHFVFYVKDYLEERFGKDFESQ